MKINKYNKKIFNIFNCVVLWSVRHVMHVLHGVHDIHTYYMYVCSVYLRYKAASTDTCMYTTITFNLFKYLCASYKLQVTTHNLYIHVHVVFVFSLCSK